ncbi:hypothetical protein ACJMK2_041975 [Sinanodonta woodiana]|uniref:Rho GTPase-activating protein 100F n=1 Tax=Sinanodonta woodiana TaxID=1069815 RepID=A0ABD3W942_SINWO
MKYFRIKDEMVNIPSFFKIYRNYNSLMPEQYLKFLNIWGQANYNRITSGCRSLITSPDTYVKISHIQLIVTAEGYYSDDHSHYYSYSGGGASGKSLSPLPTRKAASTQTPPHQSKLMRKHSADCLLAYKTYQMDETGDQNISQEQPRYTTPPHLHTASKGPKATVTTSTSTQLEKSIDTNGKTITRTSASRFRDLQLAKHPLQIQYGDFEFYKADLRKRAEISKINGLDGMLSAHILCGQGLKSTKMTLRDLYCVVSVDSLNKARTMIRTGAVNFDWDETFDIELEDAKEVSFLVYNWDPNFKHRLCFHGSIIIPGYLQCGKKQCVALKMEPKGLLYVTLLYKEPKVSLQRLTSVKKNGLFGVDLETVIRREASGMNVPALVVKCVAEVERRGLDVVGIYRLCGSARRKAQLREIFERNALVVDLSPENVSDIHVITGVLKDYLRELPEPLFTNALYQMLLDALSVRLPSDPDGSAKLMLSILECLPKANQETMATILNHLRKVASNSDKNKMTLDNLAVCLGPVLLCPSPTSSDNAALEFKKHIEVLKYLLEIWSQQPEASLPRSGSLTPKSDISSRDK